VLAKIAYKGGFGGLYVIGVFDEEQLSGIYGDYSTAAFGNSNTGGVFGVPDVFVDDDVDSGSAFAIKAGVQLENLIAADSILKIEGHYAFDPTEYAVVDYAVGDNYSIGNYTGHGNMPSEYQIGAAYQQEFGKIFAGVNGVYGKLFDEDLVYAAVGFDDVDGGEYYGAAVNLGYQITSNLSTLAEVSYRKLDFEGGQDDYNSVNGFLELRRNF
jgi:outer membrane protease